MKTMKTVDNPDDEGPKRKPTVMLVHSEGLPGDEEV